MSKKTTPISRKIKIYKTAMFDLSEFRKILADNPLYLLKTDSEFKRIANKILQNKEYQKRKTFEHHVDLSVYDHMLQVSSIAYLIAKKMGIEYKQIVIGALLHDFYYEDWRAICYDDPNIFDKHGLMHPVWALENAAINFPELMNEEVIPIIADHMVMVDALSPRLHFPRTEEAWIVAASDCVSTLTKSKKHRHQIDAKTLGIRSPKKETVHRVANPMREDFELNVDNPALNNPKEPHLKDSKLVTDFALKSNLWHAQSQNLDYVNKQFGFFFLHQKYLLEERYDWAKKGKMNDTLVPLLELKDYYKWVVAFCNDEKEVAGIYFSSLETITQELILGTLTDAKKYLSELYSILDVNTDLYEDESGLKNEFAEKEYKMH